MFIPKERGGTGTSCPLVLARWWFLSECALQVQTRVHRKFARYASDKEAGAGCMLTAVAGLG